MTLHWNHILLSFMGPEISGQLPRWWAAVSSREKMDTSRSGMLWPTSRHGRDSKWNCNLDGIFMYSSISYYHNICSYLAIWLSSYLAIYWPVSLYHDQSIYRYLLLSIMIFHYLSLSLSIYLDVLFKMISHGTIICHRATVRATVHATVRATEPQEGQSREQKISEISAKLNELKRHHQSLLQKQKARPKKKGKEKQICGHMLYGNRVIMMMMMVINGYYIMVI